jgi:hypothetical protein
MPVGVAHSLGNVVPDVAPICAGCWLRFHDFDSRLEHRRDGGDDGVEQEQDRRAKQVQKRTAQSGTRCPGHGAALSESRVGHHERIPRDDAR